MRILGLAFGMLLAGAANAAAFTNGSFETAVSAPPPTSYSTYYVGSTDIAGWTVADGSVDLIGGSAWAASDGNYSLDMDGETPGTLTQTFDTVGGAAYTVTFDLSKNTQVASALLRVSAASSTSDYAYSLNNNSTDMMWLTQTFSFVATGTNTTLSFAGIGGGNGGPALDNVRVSGAVAAAVPEPASWAMFISGFGLVGGTIRRKRMNVSLA